MSDDLLGKTIDGYEIVSRLGQGGMSTVYRAQQTSMKRAVALKILPRHFMQDETYLQRFRREVDIVARLEHRNIVPVYDYGEYDGQPYIAMRYMPGGSVDDLLAEAAGPLEMDRIVDIFTQIAPALDFAHSKNILHRDLKPSNVLLDEGDGAYITDFGIARITGGDSQQAATITTQGVVGTPAYMSPEQAKGEELDSRSDVYSLGIMLFELATGRRPFINDTPYGIAVMQVTAQPPAPRAVNPKLSGAVESVIMKALKKGRDNRYQTAVQLSESLKLAVERPDTFHDTQPRPLPIKEALELTQQSRPPSDYLDEPTVKSSVQSPSPPPQAPVSVPHNQQPHPATPPPPGYTPPPNPAMRQASMPSAVHRPVRRRKPNMWWGIIVGGLIGCALLALVVVGAAVAVGSLFGDDDDAAPVATVPPDTSSGAGIPPLDATSAAAREELLGDTSTVTATPAPVGMRQPYAETGTILYYDERPLTLTGDTDSFDIFTYDLTAELETRLTMAPAIDSYPVASPDGQRIAFQSDRDGDLEIFVINRDGSGLRQLTSNTVRDYLPAWSPDGSWIIYSSDVRDDGALDLYRVSLDNGRTEELLSTDRRSSHPRYSPDGRYVVFTNGDVDDPASWDIARLDVQTGDVMVLFDGEGRDASPVYSPDGQTVLFTASSDRGGGTVLAVIPADGSDSAQMLHQTDGSIIFGASYSPDGAYILFDEQAGDDSTLYMMRADGSELREVDAVSGGYYPSWMP